MKESFFEPRGLYYRTNEFAAGRPTLVFIHGLSGSSSAWLKYEDYFSKKYNLLSFDLRGHGKSRKPKQYADYEMKNFADDLDALLRYLDIKQCILVSHSFATLIALDFLAMFPNDVEAAVFLSPSYSVSKRLIARLLKPFFHLGRLLGVFPFSGRIGKHIDYTKYKNTGDWNIRRMIADVGNTTLRVYLYCTLQSYTVDREDFLGDIKIPVLLMQGKKDTVFPVENSIFMADKIKDSELILVDHADHIVVLNNFDEVSKSIGNFVDKRAQFAHA